MLFDVRQKLKNPTIMTYSITYTIRSLDLEVGRQESDTPFPAITIGHIIKTEAFPPFEPHVSECAVVKVSHLSQMVGDYMWHYTFIDMEPVSRD